MFKDKWLHSRRIVMLGTSLDASGGIAAVVNTLQRSGLFSNWPIAYLATHCDGTAWDKFKQAVRAMLEFLTLLVSGKIMILHVHGASRSSFWRKSVFIVLALLFKRPIIFHLHGGGFEQFYHQESGAVKKRFIRFILEHVSLVIVLSNQWQQLMKRIAPDAAVVIVPNPIEIPPAAAINLSARQNRTILFLGRLEQAKGFYDLLSALSIIKSRGVNFKLCCGGIGPFEKINAVIKQLGLENNVELLGWVTGEKKQALLAEAAIYVLPSHMEGLPMSILEAMAAMLPVIATRVGGIPDVIEDGAQGTLIPSGDIQALALALQRLLEDPALAEKMGRAGRKKVSEQFSIWRVIPIIESLYRALGAYPTGQAIEARRAA